jgi:hypothetical protein
MKLSKKPVFELWEGEALRPWPANALEWQVLGFTGAIADRRQAPRANLKLGRFVLNAM